MSGMSDLTRDAWLTKYMNRADAMSNPTHASPARPEDIQLPDAYTRWNVCRCRIYASCKTMGCTTSVELSHGNRVQKQKSLRTPREAYRHWTLPSLINSGP
jgi:hypothetical protein